MTELLISIIWLLILPISIACITWTVTHEKLFEELVDYCKKCSEQSKSLLKKKFFYLFTCEYCFSHYVTLFMIFITGYKLLLDDWRGYLIAWFSLVWVANVYMSFFGLLRVDIKSEHTEVKIKEEHLNDKKNS